MTKKRLAIAGLAFGLLALIAGVLQLSVYFTAGAPRSVVVGIFAVSVGVSVTLASVQSLRR
ncbi:hypothetical protein [Mycolicibacterium goodii]|uniref:Uncharacterized protein n=1 Tax=Mycolicibacterium goodii TaxID=134601 RepID=A0A0K0X677_MYCGD|nr:hypothetical protein AFA91_13950 [Mycolicibacterium goodii]